MGSLDLGLEVRIKAKNTLDRLSRNFLHEQGENIFRTQTFLAGSQVFKKFQRQVDILLLFVTHSTFGYPLHASG